MEYEYYQEKINDIILRAPIEAGVEILAYNLIDECIHFNRKNIDLRLIDVSRMQRDRAPLLSCKESVPDMVIVTTDFKYSMNKEYKGYMNGSRHKSVKGCVEVKATCEGLSNTEQFRGELKKFGNMIYTNGITWRICNISEIKKAWKENNEAQKLEFDEFFIKKRGAWKEDICLSVSGNRVANENTVIQIERQKFQDLKNKLSQIEW